MEIILAICVLIGGFSKAVLGWIESGEPFDGRKFAGTGITTFFSSVVAAVAFLGSYITVVGTSILVLCLMALLAGWGIDNARKVVVDTVKKVVSSEKTNS
jgi:hypothetical protein